MTDRAAPASRPPPIGILDGAFQLTERSTSASLEIIAGATTFAAMAYWTGSVDWFLAEERPICHTRESGYPGATMRRRKSGPIVGAERLRLRERRDPLDSRVRGNDM
jgi:hypothetical protein